MADYPKFSVADGICWYMLPERWGCGDEFLWKFKSGWIRHNKNEIKNAALNNNIPPFLLGGVALREVGGKDFSDWPVFFIRSFDWAGPSWVDNNLTITNKPYFTSMGAVSIQLRRVAETMGIKNPDSLTQKELTNLANALQSDVFNLNIVAKHLLQLILVDNPDYLLRKTLTDEQIRIAGTRYWWGPENSLEFIKKESMKSSSYGSFILKHKQKVIELLQ